MHLELTDERREVLLSALKNIYYEFNYDMEEAEQQIYQDLIMELDVD